MKKILTPPKAQPLSVKVRKIFPDPAGPTLDGIVTMGQELTTQALLEAYSFGIFPWPHQDLPCLWFCPDERGVIDFSELHISQSMKKFIKKNKFQITFNTHFNEVISKCSETPRIGQTGTWITPQIIKTYEEFHNLGYAHSIECWREDENTPKELVGGLYGVYVAGVFSGESMFFKEPNASKLCLIQLILELQKQGLTWMDIQMITPVTAALGGKYIPKHAYLERLAAAKTRAKPLKLSSLDIASLKLK